MTRRLLALVVLVLVAAACSGGSPTTSSSTSSGSAPAPSSPAPSESSTSSSSGAAPAAAWTTWGGDPARSGVSSDGPPAAGLQQVWVSEGIDGDVYGEPLVVGGLVIVATSNDSVYAFDAKTGDERWKQLSLGQPVSASVPPCGNVDPIGITSTPVADPAGNRLYVVGMTQPLHHELFALALDTGQVVFHRPVDAPGADPLVHNQRGGLAFANGRVYVPFGGRFGDCGDYKGRVVSVAGDGSGDLTTYAVRANREGGFWAPPGPVVAPDGRLYVTSGNSDSRSDFDDGNAVIHLSADLTMTDEFAPTDFAQLNAGDVDLGTTDPALLDGNRVFQIGKNGVGYVADTTHLGGVGGQLHTDKVCDRAFGGLAHEGSTVFIPCGSTVLSVAVSDQAFTQQWSASVPNPGPPIVAGDLVWVLDVRSGTVHALDKSDGTDVFHAPVGQLTHFSAPSAGNGLVFVAGGGRVQAFGPPGGGTDIT